MTRLRIAQFLVLFLFASGASVPLAAQDINGDGRVDAVFTQKQHYNQVCFGNGTGAFTRCTDVKGAGDFQLSAAINTTASALLDSDQDGDLDIVFAMEGHSNVVCFNDGGGSFNTGLGCVPLYGYSAFPYNSQAVAVGDLDADGSPDLIFANGGSPSLSVGQPNLACIHFSVCVEFGGEEPSTGVALGDLDGDGDLDVIFSNRGTTNTVCLNLGHNSSGILFDCRSIAPASGISATKESNAVAVGNFPPAYGIAPDGWLDVVFANNGRNERCLGDGNWSEPGGGLVCRAVSTASTYTVSDATARSTKVVVADILGGTNLFYLGDEMLFSNDGAPNVYCYNGGFSCTFGFNPPSRTVPYEIGGTIYQVSEPVSSNSMGIAVAQIDQIGRLDVVVANVGESRSYMGLFTEIVANPSLNPTSVVLSGGTVGPSSDTEPPVILGATDVTVEATGPSGAVVNFSVTAIDDGGGIPVSCSATTGATFAIGATAVNCSAVDLAGNSTSASFTITVADRTRPSIDYPANLEILLPSGQTSTLATFTVNAVDLVDGALPVQCTPASGSRFSTGYTLVQCTATDSHNNTATTQFYVVVTELTPTQQITDLSRLVTSTISNGSALATLQNTLNTILWSLQKSNGTAAITAAKNQLGAFQNQVKALANSRRISTAEANALTAAAGRIIASL